MLPTLACLPRAALCGEPRFVSMKKGHNPMPEDFEDHLSKICGTVRRINSRTRYEMHRDALAPYYNKAEELHGDALIIWNAHKVENHPVFSFLAGLSLEVLIKGICKGLARPTKNIHRLVDLSASAGIRLNDDDVIILRAMTEYIYWAGRYTTPTTLRSWLDAEDLFSMQERPSGGILNMYIKERTIDLENYDRLWEMFGGYFWRVEESTYESVEFMPNAGLP
jgi:hypothetical protein